MISDYTTLSLSDYTTLSLSDYTTLYTRVDSIIEIYIITAHLIVSRGLNELSEFTIIYIISASRSLRGIIPKTLASCLSDHSNGYAIYSIMFAIIPNVLLVIFQVALSARVMKLQILTTLL